MRSTLCTSTILLVTFVACSQSPSSPHSENQVFGAPDSLGKTLEVLVHAAQSWTPEQKQEFADVFFMERGKFAVPKEPIVLKTFKNQK